MSTDSYFNFIEEKDDYSLSHILTEGLRYCSEHKHKSRPLTPLSQVRESGEETIHIEHYKEWSSTASIMPFNQDITNLQVQGADSTQKVGSEAELESASNAKEWETLLKFLKPFPVKFQKTDSGKKALDMNDLMEKRQISGLGAPGSSSSSSKKMEGRSDGSPARPPAHAEHSWGSGLRKETLLVESSTAPQTRIMKDETLRKGKNGNEGQDDPNLKY